jgi:hypothetical protein
MATKTPTIAEPEFDIVNAADRFAQLHKIKQAWEAVMGEFRLLQDAFRETASDRDMDFPTSDGLFVVRVTQKPDKICAVVPDEHLEAIVKASGEHVWDLYHLHPWKGDERSFELNCLKLRPKRDANKIFSLLKAKATAFVQLFRS